MAQHNIIDTDKRFLIDPVTRSITNAGDKAKLIQFDHNSERFTFEVPRHIDAHDMSLCSKVEVHYINISGDKQSQHADVYPVDDVAVDPTDEEKVTFSWLVSAGATQYAGTLSFLVRFACLTGEKLDYVWNTAPFKGITVGEGMNNGEKVIEDYSDVLEAWEQRVLSCATDAETAAKAAEEAAEEARAARAAAEAKAGKSAYELALENGFEGTEEEWLASLKGEKGDAGKDGVVTNLAQTTGDSETEVMSQKAVTTELDLIHTGSIVPVNAEWENGSLSSTGTEAPNDNWVRMTEKLTARKNARLYILSDSSLVSAWVCEYDATGVCLGRIKVNSPDGLFTPKEECKTLRVALYSTTVAQEELVGHVRIWYDVWSIVKLNEKIDSKMTRQIYPFDSILIKSINHRGFNREAPENTLPAYRLSAQKGFTFVETDLTITADGVWVLLHDDTVDRTSNGTGNLSEMTLEQARALDFGSWKAAKYAGTKIPTLEEFLFLCRSLNLYPYLELKNGVTYTQEQIKSLVDTVKECGMEKAVSYICFDRLKLEQIAKESTVARIGLLKTGSAITQEEITKFKWLDTGVNQLFIDINENWATAEVIEICKTNGLPLEVYCPNIASNIVNADPYITGFTSDELVAAEVIKNANIGDDDGLL